MLCRKWNICKSIFIFVVAFLCIFFGAFAHGQDLILRVDSSNTVSTGDGSSWGNSSIRYLQDALQDARDYLAIPGNAGHDVEIWVRAGLHFPDSGDGRTLGSRDESFHIVNNTRILGRFESGDSSVTDREPDENTTILSGEIGTSGSNSDNSFHVVAVASASQQPPNNSTAIIDGFEISDGKGEATQRCLRSHREYKLMRTGHVYDQSTNINN